MAALENQRHETFAQGLFKGLSQRIAYREAFPNSKNWKDETVDAKASVLAKTDKVLERLAELAEQASSEAVMSVRERKEYLTRVVNGSEKTADKLKAIDIMNRMEGVYVTKVEGDVNARLEDLL